MKSGRHSLFVTQAVITCIFLCASVVVANAKAQFVTFDADSRGDTTVTGVNSVGEVIGFTAYGGFLREPDGTVTELVTDECAGSIPNAINDNGYIAGTCAGPVQFGFLRSTDGTVTTFNISGSDQTTVTGINNQNQIVGSYWDGSRDHGFLRQPDATIEIIDIDGVQDTDPSAINENGDVVGSYAAEDAWHGFLRSPRGKVTEFDVLGGAETLGWGLNNAGVIFGAWSTTGQYLQSFIRNADGTIVTFDVNDGPALPSGINEQSTVSGRYSRGGFIRQASGRIRTFAIPHTRSSIESAFVNDSGIVAGTYIAKTAPKHFSRYGYIRIP